MVRVIDRCVDSGSRCSHCTATQLLKKKSPNSRMLLCITSLKSSFAALVGNLVGISSWYYSIHSSIFLVPCSVSMLVYIDLVSAVNSFAPGGSVP